MAKNTFDIKHEATRYAYAGAGVIDLAVEFVRDTAADAQKRLVGLQKQVDDFDFEPKAVRAQAESFVSARVDALTKEAQARRTAVEKRVSELQKDARTTIDDNVATVTSTYDELAKRGENLVLRIRRQEATQRATGNARTTASKAKTTGTQAKKATKSTASSAKKSASATKKSAAKKAQPAKQSAKATGTAAKKTASSATKATGDAASKVGN